MCLGHRPSRARRMPLARAIVGCCLALVLLGACGSLPPRGSPLPEGTAAAAAPQSSERSGDDLVATVRISIPSGGYGGQDFHPLDWSPDGSALAFCWGDGLWIAEGPGFAAVPVARIPGGRVVEARWSPGGTRIGLLVEQQLPQTELWGSSVWVVDVDRPQARTTKAEALDPLRPKSLNRWLDDRTLSVNLWQGGGAQALYLLHVETGEVGEFIGEQVQEAGGDYFWSPDGEHVAVQHCCFEKVAVIAATHPQEAIWLSSLEQPPYQSFQGWLPDGHTFLYTEQDIYIAPTSECTDGFSLWLWDVQTRARERLLDNVCRATPSPDGSRIALLRADETDSHPSDLALAVLDVPTGQVTPLGPAGPGWVELSAFGNPEARVLRPPAWSPDGTALAAWDVKGDVWLVQADGVARHRLSQGLAIVDVAWSPDGEHLVLRTSNQGWILEPE